MDTRHQKRRGFALPLLFVGLMAMAMALSSIHHTFAVPPPHGPPAVLAPEREMAPAPEVVIAVAVSPEDMATARRLADDQLWLARICAHELTWDVERDCEPMYQVFRSIIRMHLGPLPDGSPRPLRDAIAFYCKRFSSGRTNRIWTTRLVPGQAAPPEGWPPEWGTWDYVNASTGETHAQSWARVYEYAGRVVRGEVQPVCDIQPRHWGSRSPQLPDLERAERAIKAGRWRRAYCPGARQGYYAVNGRTRLLALDAQAP